MVYERMIESILERLGVTRSYHGFQYTVRGCVLALEDERRLQAVTKMLYYDVAKQFGTTWNCVERDIRTVVEVVWRNGDKEMLLEFCGGTEREKPTASIFVEMMCEYVKKNSVGDCYCPETGKWCSEKACLQKQIRELTETYEREAAATRE